MHRREFFGTAVAASIPMAICISAHGRPLKLLSTQGKSGQKVHDFLASGLGPNFEVLEIEQSGNHLVAKISFQNRAFFLKSMDGKTWYTMDYEL